MNENQHYERLKNRCHLFKHRSARNPNADENNGDNPANSGRDISSPASMAPQADAGPQTIGASLVQFDAAKRFTRQKDTIF